MTVQNWLSFLFQIPHMILSSIKTKCIEGTENEKLFVLQHMLHTFHLWVSYCRFLWCEIKPISYLFCVARMWPFLSFEDFWDFFTLEIMALTESLYSINITPFVERLFNLVSMPLIELNTGNSEAVPCSLEKNMEDTFIYTLKDSLITYLQHQMSWPYWTGIRILYSCVLILNCGDMRRE